MTPAPDPKRAPFLAGVRVLELGDSVAGAAATSILWSLGAEVTTAASTASPHRRAHPTVHTDAGDVSLLGLSLDRGKDLIWVDDAAQIRALLDEPFDLIVADRVAPGSAAVPEERDAYLGLVAASATAWVTISAFGLSGPRADEGATDLTVAAASGMLSAVRDPDTAQPLKLAGQQSLLNAGQAAALAACQALDLTSDGVPVHLDLSAVEATLAMGPVLEVGGLLLSTLAAGGAKRYGAPASFYACTDGLVRISAMEDHQWNGVVTAMGSPTWAEAFSTVEARIAAPEQVDAHVAAWTATRTKQDAETVLQANGVPATAVYSPSEIFDSPQLAHRRAFEPLVVDDSATSVVGLPVSIGDSPQPQPKRRSLRGLRLLEASRVLAVPLCGAILGALGVTVTKLEDLPRLDMYRRRGPYVDGEPGMERSAYFALMNHSKGSVAFDVDADPARLAEIVAASDVVIENLGPKRAAALGLSAATALAHHPDLLVVSSSGFGNDGPHASYRAYAYNLQASCALGYLTRNHEGTSAEIDIAWADLVSGYALATLIAAWAVGPAGNSGAALDFAMADLVVAHFNDHLAAAGLAPGGDDAERANDLAPYAPHGVYPTRDGHIAVAVHGDEQYQALAKVLSLDDSSFAGAAGRMAHRPELDIRVAAATSQLFAEHLAGDLRAVGVPAERVLAAKDLVEDLQLVERGFFAPVDHPEWGIRRVVGIPWRVYGGPALGLRPPPPLRPIQPPKPAGESGEA